MRLTMSTRTATMALMNKDIGHAFCKEGGDGDMPMAVAMMGVTI